MHTFLVENIIDTGFVLLVTIACWKMLLGRSASSDKQHERWRSEFKEVEQTLSALIAEATTSSQHFDRQLIRRQEELTDLLGKLEYCQNNNVQNIDSQTSKREISSQSQISRAPSTVDDFPNKTWLNPTKQQGKQKTSSTTNSYNRTGSAPTQNKQQKVFQKGIQDSIEIMQELTLDSNTDEDAIEHQTLTTSHSTSPVIDPTAYKIAKRLLSEGREIHVVSRKLGLPLSEVRALDRLVRPRSDNDSTSHPNNSLLEQSLENFSSISESSSDIDRDIDFGRESVLL